MDSDNPPRRPLRCAASVQDEISVRSCLPSLAESDVTEEDFFPVIGMMEAIANKDTAPNKPTKYTSSVMTSTSSLCSSIVGGMKELLLTDSAPKMPIKTGTICPSIAEEAPQQEELYTVEEPARLSSESAVAHHQAREREQPNEKTPTTPMEQWDCPNRELLSRRRQAVEEFWRMVNRCDLPGLSELCSDNFRVLFCGYKRKVKHHNNLEGMLGGIQTLFDACPDFALMHGGMAVSNTSSVGREILIVQQFVGTGTHTGKPFALPGTPPVAASGKFIVLDECEVHMVFEPNSSKICRVEEYALGEHAGFPGIYELLRQPAQEG